MSGDLGAREPVSQGAKESDWADTLAEKLLAEMRGKPRVVVLRILADAFRREMSALREKLTKAEADLDIFEPVREEFEGRFVDANHFGYCKDCGAPYVEGEKIWWLGPGKGAYCEGCQKASEWAKRPR